MGPSYKQKGVVMRQLMLRYVKEEPKAVALESEVEKSVMALMACMIADIIRKQEGSRDEKQTDQQQDLSASP